MRASTPPSSRARSTARRPSRRAPARGRRSGRASRRRGAALPPRADGWETSGDARSSTIPTHCTALVCARESERGRAARLRGRRLGVRRPRRPPPRGRRQSRLARSRATPSCRCSRSASRPRRRASPTSCPPCSRTSVSSLLRTYARSARCLTGTRWSSSSCARAASTTSACWRRWRACRASSSCRRSCAAAHMTMRRCRSAPTRRSRSRTWSRASARELQLRGDERVLDVGTGSGYQAAVLAELAREVHSLERIPELAERARASARRGRLRRPRPRARRRRHPGAAGAAPFGGDRRRRRRAASRRRRCSSSSSRGGRLVIPVGPAHQQLSGLRPQTPEGPADFARRPVPLRAARRRTVDVCAASARLDSMADGVALRGGALQLPVGCTASSSGGRPTCCSTSTAARVGFVVRCGDESQRFLPLAASQTASDEIAVRRR